MGGVLITYGGEALAERDGVVVSSPVQEGASPPIEEADEYREEEPVAIADPLEGFNRAMFVFNDKLYFWVLKPVAQGYRDVVPEPARAGVDRFFNNVTFPVRFVSCLLQANFKGAASETGRFVVNTVWGLGGFLDPASNEDIKLNRYDEDVGRAFGSYGIGHGFFVMWPFFGPSSLRDTVGMAGDYFLDPLSYVHPWYDGALIKGYDKVNATSLSIGDYEALKAAAIDPYIAIRNAYVQHRKRSGGRSSYIAPTQKHPLRVHDEEITCPFFCFSGDLLGRPPRCLRPGDVWTAPRLCARREGVVYGIWLSQCEG